MTARAAITKATIRRAIAVAREAGLPVVEVHMPSGAILRFPVDPEATSTPSRADGENPCDAAFGVAP